MSGCVLDSENVINTAKAAKTANTKMVLTAALSERSAEYSQNSSISSNSEWRLAISLYKILLKCRYSHPSYGNGGGGGDGKMAAAMAAVKGCCRQRLKPLPESRKGAEAHRQN